MKLKKQTNTPPKKNPTKNGIDFKYLKNFSFSTTLSFPDSLEFGRYIWQQVSNEKMEGEFEANTQFGYIE